MVLLPPSSHAGLTLLLRFADYSYTPGWYEVVGPRDANLELYSEVKADTGGYLTPSVMGHKISATCEPVFDTEHFVMAYLYEGHVIWIAPQHRIPLLLPSDEARVFVCFGNPENESDWGWITCNPCANNQRPYEHWIRMSSARAFTAQCATAHLSAPLGSTFATQPPPLSDFATWPHEDGDSQPR